MNRPSLPTAVSPKQLVGGAQTTESGRQAAAGGRSGVGASGQATESGSRNQDGSTGSWTGVAGSAEYAAVFAPVHGKLLSWYAQSARDLPWRRTRDPYAILVSEVMLQQTQVERVVPKYGDFLARFPTLRALAASSRADVIRAWSPLGYNLRAVRLHGIAQQAVQQFGGVLPSSGEDLLRLKGLGPYTAAAIACFAYGQQRATVDTNVRRVLARLFLGREDGRELGPRDTAALAEQALPPGRAYEWNQALMDLGATICTARRPACQRCPASEACAARPKLHMPNGKPVVREARAQYGGASRYEHSSRYYRGRAVEALRALPDGQSMQLGTLGVAIRADFQEQHLPWLVDLLQGLERDGLVGLVGEGPNGRPADAACILVSLA